MGTLFLLPESKLAKTPSAQDNLSIEDEYELRILGCELIQSSGLILKLPQTAMATAQVLFHRFYYSKSFVRYSIQHTAMACVVLASKIEESQLRIREVIKAFHRLNQIRKNQIHTEIVINDKYVKLKNEVVKAERRILKELGFCVYVNHPHKFIVTLLQILDNVDNQEFVQTAWSYMNDGLRTDVFLRYSPEAIACSCVYLSARLLGIPLPESPPWWEIFLVAEDDIQKICKIILKLYTRPKPDEDRLESVIAKLRKECERSRSNIIKQLSQATNEMTTSSPTNHQPSKKIKVEHIIQDVKLQRLINSTKEELNSKDENISRRKRIHERNHSRSPIRDRSLSKRSRSKSKEKDNSRRKYSSKYYKDSKDYSKDYLSKDYSSKDYASKDYSSSKDYSNSSKEYYDKYDDRYNGRYDDKYDDRYNGRYDDKYDDYYNSKKSKDRDRGSSLKSKDSMQDQEYRSSNNSKSKYRY